MQYLPRITTKNQEFILTFLILSLIYVLAFVIRLFGVVSHESTIQEVDSYFNYRSTIHLIENGLDSFNNWFDTASWYPLGRAVGETVYPGLMWTTAGLYHLLRYFNLTVEIKNVCVFIAPFFASNTAMLTYLFAKEIDGRKATGFLAAAIVAIVPGYISRSVAGSFKSEVIAIFALILTFYTWVKALKNGSLFWSGFCAVSYFYMVSAWGGYVYVINVIPLHVISLLLMGRYSHRLYVAYSTLYTLGTMLAMQIPFVGFQHVQSNEHMLAMITFIVLQFFVMFSYLQQILGEAAYTKVSRTLIPVVIGVGVALFFLGQQAGFITPFTGRFYAFLDPLYARKHLPSLTSDPQTHPTAWGSFFFDLNFLALLFPAGVYFCLNPLTDAHLFLIIYGTTSVYFTGVMNRFMVVLSPVAAIMAAISLQRTVSEYMKYYKPKPKRIISKSIVEYEKQQEIAQIIIGGIFFLLVIFTWHCTWVAATQYSSPALILSARGVDGRKITFDDFREGYAWMRMNTPENAKILAWSDYGYQINTLGNRTTLVDSNHMNNTHLAHVALTLLSEEAEAYKLCRNMGVDYVMVVFGGYTGYQSDDINKLIWMVRIAASEKPEIVESDFTTSRGEFSVGSKGSRKLLNSLVYKLAYYQFGKLSTVQDEPSGYDLIRGVEIGNKDYVLNYFEEAYTSQHLLVRIYKVKEPSNRF